MMSRKDYVAFAAELAAQRKHFLTCSDKVSAYAVESVADGIANVFAADNPRFDRVRFLAACSNSR
jgi:hypothetical protein